MSVIDDKVGIDTNHEDEDSVEEKQSLTVNDDEKEGTEGSQEMEERSGEGLELSVDKREVVNDRQGQDGKEDEQEKVKYFEATQESAEHVITENEPEKFKGSEAEPGPEGEHVLVREHDTSKKINQDTTENDEANKSPSDKGNPALEDGEGQVELFDPVDSVDGYDLGSEVLLNEKKEAKIEKYMERTPEAVDYGERVLPHPHHYYPHQLNSDDIFETMHEANQNTIQEKTYSGSVEVEQLEGSGKPSDADKDHNGTGLSTSVGLDVIADHQAREVPSSHLSNTPESHVPAGLFLHTKRVEAKSAVMDMDGDVSESGNKEESGTDENLDINTDGDVSESGNKEESGTDEKLDVKGGNGVVEEPGKHLETLNLRAKEFSNDGNSRAKEFEAGKLNDSEEEVQAEIEQAENKIAELSNSGKETRNIVQGANWHIEDAGNVPAIVEILGENNEQNKGHGENIDGIQYLVKEMPFQIDTTSEVSQVNDEKQVVVEAIPVAIEEKVIPAVDDKRIDQIQHEDMSTTEVHEAFNNTDGREKKPVPDAVLTVESNRDRTTERPNSIIRPIIADNHQSDSESSEDESEGDENIESRPPLAARPVVTADSIGTSLNSSGLSLPARPAGLGSSVPLLEPAVRQVPNARANSISVSHTSQLAEEQISAESDENNETREKLQMIRVKFLRLAHRLGQTPHNVVVSQVLYRLGLAEQLRGGRNASRTGPFSFDRANAIAEQQEAAGQEGLDFTCTIMVLGKTGVGKSATINSVFDEVRCTTDAFQSGTRKVREIIGTVQGIRIRVIDTPGLLTCASDQYKTERTLRSVKHFIKKTPPDIVLYFDRLDMQSKDYGDLPLLRTITETFAPAVWFNAIVVLTHAASAPPDGPNGTAMNYEMFVSQRSHVVQQAIRQAAGDMRLMNPVALVENHSACRTNRAGQRVLPNGQIWKPQLLLLCFASKILAEANALLNFKDSSTGKPFGTRSRVPPLPFLLSSLLQSRTPPSDELGDEDSDEEVEEASDSEDESEYDKLPPFRYLSKSELSDLNKELKEAYFSELDAREKLFMKKQLNEERKLRRFMKKQAAEAQTNDNVEEESAGPEPVPVEMPDMTLPPSFDADNPTYRYRYHDASNQSDQWLVRPVLETHGWDHDVGYEGVNVEKNFVIRNKIPVSVSGQITKEKKDSTLQMECAASLKHGEGKTTLAGLDIQTVGKELAYSLRSETRFSNFKHNKTIAGLAITLLGDAIAAGMKLEDRLMIGKRLKLVLNGGAITSRGDVAYGGSVEATLRHEDYPIVRSLSTLGLSIMDWHGDLAIGCNLQSQFPAGRKTNMTARANLNNRGAGQVSIRTSSSDQLQIALIGIIPVVRIIAKKLSGSSDDMQ